jgi:glycosyltransferase involved in cell wall biosynthesis
MSSDYSAGRPSLEIFVPFWGDPVQLYDALDSIRAQTDPSWTAIVVDDCYPDPSVGESFAAETDPRIRYLRNTTNLGIAANFQQCLDLASGDLVMFMGCDDLLHPDFTARARAGFERFPDASMYQPGVRVVDDAGRPAEPLADRVKRWLAPRVDTPTVLAGQSLATSLLHGNWLYWPSLVFRTERLRQHRFRQDLPIILDLAIVLELIADGAALVLDPETTFSYRRHTTSLSGAGLRDGSRFADDRRFFAEASEQMRAVGWPRAARAARARWTSRMHGLSMAPGALRTGDVAGVRAAIGHAIRPT